jgi:hypothetical protein
MPEGSQEYGKILFFLVCSQIWLNDFLDDYHLGCFTKSFKKTQLGIITDWQVKSSSLHYTA